MQGPHSICLLNDSFPPLIDGVANTVVNYAQELTKLGDQAIVVTPEHPDADDCRFSFPVARQNFSPSSCALSTVSPLSGPSRGSKLMM